MDGRDENEYVDLGLWRLLRETGLIRASDEPCLAEDCVVQLAKIIFISHPLNSFMQGKQENCT